MMAVDSPRDFKELAKIMLSRVCKLVEGADAIMLGIIRINYMSRKTITMHLESPTQILILERPKENTSIQQWFSLNRTLSDLNMS